MLAVALAYGDTSVALTHPSKVRTTAFVVTVLLALAAGTFAAGKFRLAYRLPRGTHKTRDAVIAVEVMGGFAALILLALLLSVFGLILSPPIIIGGITSVWVANGLTKPPARWYFDASEAAQSRPPDLGPCHGSATRLNSVLV